MSDDQVADMLLFIIKYSADHG